MLGMRVKNGAKKILFAVILGLPLMMAIAMPPAYAAPPDAVCVGNPHSGTFCTTVLSGDSINHVLAVGPSFGGPGVTFVCHFEKIFATPTFFFGAFAHTDERCPFTVGNTFAFFYVVV